MVFSEKKCCGDNTLYNGRHAVVLQAQAKCFVLQHIKVHYISLQFNSVVCNYSFFQLILTCNLINHFGHGASTL